MYDKHPEYFNWFDTVSSAVATQTRYSLACPLTTREECNDLGQRYYGPVILITSGLCYSTGDIFAAGFKDHKIGNVLGVDRRTGAGGAEVLTYSNLLATLRRLPGTPDIPFRDLPGGVDLRFAVRRTLRVGENAGIQLEDLGVEADIPYRMSADDLLWDNVDLLRKAAEVPGQETCYRLRQTGPVERAEKTVAADRCHCGRGACPWAAGATQQPGEPQVGPGAESRGCAAGHPPQYGGGVSV